MLNLRTHKILISRDVIWMNCIFGDDDETPPLLPDDEDDLGDPAAEPDETPSAPPTAEPPNPPALPPEPPIPQELRNLQSDLAPSLLGPGNRQTGRERAHLMSDNSSDPYESSRRHCNKLYPISHY